MRPEITNELLLQVIHAWDPAKAIWWDMGCRDDLLCYRGYGLRESGGTCHPSTPTDPWLNGVELIEFLLKDRPDLVPGNWPNDVVQHCYREWDMAWACDPFENLGVCTAEKTVARIKSYEYLKEWKEKQELVPCRNPDESDAELRDRLTATIKVSAPYVWSTKTLKGVPAPETYEQICPQCNGSKEVTGWLGKEPCSACC